MPDPIADELDPQGLQAGSENTHEKRYIIRYCEDDEIVAYTTLRNTAPAEYDHPEAGTIPLESLTLEAYQGNGIWYGKANYSSKQAEDADGEAGTGETPENAPQPPASNEDIGGGISFTTIGGTLHIQQSLETVASVAAGGGAVPDTKRAIGVHGDSDQIDGTDIVVPKLEITIKRKFSQVTPAYLQVLRDLTGTVNNAKFFRFEAGEVLFMGCTGELGNAGWDLSFSFAISKNEPVAPAANVDVGNGMTFTTKKGWYYIWCSYSPATNNNALTRQPIYAFLERVYREENFARLGLFANG